MTRLIAAFVSSSPAPPFDAPASSSLFDAVVVTTDGDGVVFGFFRCPRRFVDNRSPPGIIIEPPEPFPPGLFTDGIVVVGAAGGVAGVTALTFDAIQAK